jgi:type IV pilus assembly protein PilV
MKIQQKNKYQGMTLIEVLVTVVILAVGVLAVVGLQVSSKQANYEAIQRTTASHLAFDIAERMRANSGSLNSYLLGSDIGGGSLSVPGNTCSAAPGCSGTAMAAFDLYQFETLLDGATETRNGGADNAGGLVSPQACITGPGGGGSGIYTIAISWRGLRPLSDPTINACGSGSGLYGVADEYRRVLVFTVFIA